MPCPTNYQALNVNSTKFKKLGSTWMNKGSAYDLFSGVEESTCRTACIL